MICSECGKKMAAGVLQAGGSRGGSIIFWAKEKRKWMMRPSKGDIAIASKPLGSSALTAWICPACQLVLFSYKEAGQ